MVIFKKIGLEFDKLPLKKLYLTSFGFSIISIIFGLLAQMFLPPEIPLFYGLPQTTEQIAKSIFITLPSLISFLIIFINVLISININDNYIKKTLAFASLSVSILAVVTTYKIIFMVGAI